jgi:hypothetical protein
MSTQPTTPLPALPPMGRSVRAYFAPVDRVHRLPTLFDPSVNGRFATNTPPTPWMDLGWIEDFTRRVHEQVRGAGHGQSRHYAVSGA